jgi:hypothetical protein
LKKYLGFHNLIKNCQIKSCWWCHSPEEHPRWELIPQNENELEISFNATWGRNWEPFYIAQRNSPLYDERFKQYGFDRQQQICNLWVAGYKFSIMNNAFLVHDVSFLYSLKLPTPRNENFA